MVSMDEKSNTITLTIPVSDCFCIYLAVGLCLIAITIRWAINSFKEPGGLLHGARITLRPYYYARPWFPFDSGYPDATRNEDDTCDLHDQYEDPLSAIRTEFGSGATTVYGWPSTGGIWVHEDCYGVELDFLGLSRFEKSPTKRFSKEEDNFCKLLEWIGGRFYESESIYNRNRSRHRGFDTWYGWPGAVPEAGVWALKTGRFEGAQKGVSRIRNAFTMKERCEAIEMLGGRFYEKWDDVAKAESNSSGKDVL